MNAHIMLACFSNKLFARMYTMPVKTGYVTRCTWSQVQVHFPFPIACFLCFVDMSFLLFLDDHLLLFFKVSGHSRPERTSYGTIPGCNSASQKLVMHDPHSDARPPRIPQMLNREMADFICLAVSKAGWACVACGPWNWTAALVA